MNIFQAATGRKKHRPVLVIIIGESNSGGYVLNSTVPDGLLTTYNSVQILNNFSFLFEDLQMTVNNTLDHTGGLTGDTWCGMELGLALRANVYDFYGTGCKLIKTGHGGSTISQWSSDGTYFGKFIQRIEAAQSQINFASYKIVVLFSLGINDTISGTPMNTWKTGVSNLIANMRSVIGQGNTPVIMTGFEGMGTGGNQFNAVTEAMAELTTTEANVHKITAAGAPLGDPNHWNYTGMRIITNRLLTLFESL
jgi:hypothetical protein